MVNGPRRRLTRPVYSPLVAWRYIRELQRLERNRRYLSGLRGLIYSDEAGSVERQVRRLTRELNPKRKPRRKGTL